MTRSKRGAAGPLTKSDEILAAQNAAALDRLEEQIDALVDQVDQAQKNHENLDKLSGEIDRIGERVKAMGVGSGKSQQLGRPNDDSEESTAELERKVFDL